MSILNPILLLTILYNKLSEKDFNIIFRLCRPQYFINYLNEFSIHIIFLY